MTRHGKACRGVVGSVQRLKDKVNGLLAPGNKEPWPDARDRLNRLLHGWSGYGTGLGVAWLRWVRRGKAVSGEVADDLVPTRTRFPVSERLQPLATLASQTAAELAEQGFSQQEIDLYFRRSQSPEAEPERRHGRAPQAR